MYLLINITILCFITAFIHHLLKPIVSLLTGATREEQQLQQEIQKLKIELSEIPMRQEYTNYVKTERKIVTLQAKLNNLKGGKQTKNLVIQFGVPYGAQFLLTLTMIILSIVYRYSPVLVLDNKQFDLVPFGTLIRFPTGVNGAVSVPFWIFVSSFVAKHAASYV